MRIGVLTNLSAGRNEDRIQCVLDEISKHPEVIRRETSSNAMVPEAVAEFAAEGVGLLVLNGGDGTVHRALTEVLGGPVSGWRPLIAPTRCGRTNMIALDIGVRRDPVRGVRDLLGAARAGRLQGRVVERPVLRLELDGREAPLYGMFFGAGMLQRAIQLTHRSFPEGRAQGVFGAAVVTAALIARTVAGDHRGVLDPDKMQISIDRSPLDPDEFTLVMATTLERLILGLRPFWGSEAAPIHVTSLAAGAQGLARALPNMVRGRSPSRGSAEPGFHSCNASEVVFRLDCGVTLDGEIFAPEPGRLVRLSAPDRLRFLR